MPMYTREHSCKHVPRLVDVQIIEHSLLLMENIQEPVSSKPESRVEVFIKPEPHDEPDYNATPNPVKNTLRRDNTWTQEITLSRLIPSLGNKRKGLRQLGFLCQDGKRWLFGSPLVTIGLRVEFLAMNIY
uniref:Uncharacterized protein n=1 Tax=Timema genevievae TaxID=629358 RepID=A0A7R9K7N0_TIMGE|nr:unnamed protein product [Timema genevievae]